MQSYKVEDTRSSRQVRYALTCYLKDMQTATTSQILAALGLEGCVDYLGVFKTEGWVRASPRPDGNEPMWSLVDPDMPCEPPAPHKPKKRMVLDEVRALLEKEGPLTLEQIHAQQDVSYGAVRSRLTEWASRGYIGLKNVRGVCTVAHMPGHEAKALSIVKRLTDAKRGTRERSQGAPQGPRHRNKTSQTQQPPPPKKRRRNSALEEQRARAAKLLQPSGRQAGRPANCPLPQEAANSDESLHMTQALSSRLERLAGKVRSHRELARMIDRPHQETLQALQAMQAQGLAEARQDGWVAPGAPLEIITVYSSNWASSHSTHHVVGTLVKTLEEGRHVYIEQATGRRWYDLSDARSDLASSATKAS